jgi:hypothetical protein
MRVLGVSCRLQGGSPVLYGIVLEGSRTSPRVVRAFPHQASQQDDLPLQLWKISDDLQSVLRELHPEAAVIRIPDWAPRERKETIRKRALVEGVLLATARPVTKEVESLTGREVGARCGTTKADAESRAAGLAGEEFKEAAAAALAALPE